MTQVYAFKGQDRVFGFTRDDQAANLPDQYGPWTLFKTLELYHDEPHPGVDARECLDDIEAHGFHLTSAHKRITDLALK